MEEKVQEDGAIEDEYEGDDKEQCGICGRSFKPEALEKHEKICKKVFATKRKAFDTKKTRIIDGEHAMMLKHQEHNEKKKGKFKEKEKKNKTQNWKKQSNELRAVCRLKEGDDPLSIPSSIADDYIPCQYCNRKYNEQAYNKHLNMCKNKFIKNTTKPKTNHSNKPNLGKVKK